ncbi:MAG: flagellar biosynthesis protein FlhB [Oceanospirillales bacterium]|nr:MAG: flagellar biosynthesis protein FlhB [Oceanospirillales bacterium]
MKITVNDDVSKKQAVALKYDQEKGTAPKVIAKGKGLIAEQIIALAEEHDIHIHENPELLEVLIRLELGDEIPETLYKAIAEVIAFAYNLKNSTNKEQ